VKASCLLPPHSATNPKDPKDERKLKKAPRRRLKFRAALPIGCKLLV